MTDNIKIVVSPDEAECIYRAINYYVEAFDEGRGNEVFRGNVEEEWRMSDGLLHRLADLVFPEPKYDPYGQRMTDCCGGFSTYGPDVNLDNLDSVPLKCAVCGRLTTKGEGDQTEFEDGVTPEIWLARWKAHEALAQEEG